MKAAYIERTGPPEVITYGDLPDPRVSRTQCLIRVSAVDVNPIDTYQRSGRIPVKLKFPWVVGCDLAGTVEQVGPGVTQFKIGDRVWASNQGLLGRQGTFSELAVVDQRWLYPTPTNVKDEEVVALSLVAITAHLGLVRRAKVKPGEVLFVNGGSGGVGSAVVQMARLLGGRVIATAGSEEKLKICRELGAEQALNYKTEDVDSAIKAFAPGGIDIWWETQREPDFMRTVPLLAKGGRMIVMAGREAAPSFPVGPFYVKDCSLHGFAMFNASPRQQRKSAEDINRWISDGKLKARIDRVLPLSEAAQAHRLQEESTVQKSGVLTGKIVLKP